MSNEKPAGPEFMSREWYTKEAERWAEIDGDAMMASFYIAAELAGIREELRRGRHPTRLDAIAVKQRDNV